jgi:hypothetical protein
MGSELIVQSQVGEGTTFRFDLPVEVVDQGQTPLVQAAHQVVEPAPGQEAGDEQAQGMGRLDPSLLQSLPSEWRTTMHRALVIGDIAQIGELIGRLPGPQVLVDELQRRADQFEFESMLEWIEAAQDG